MMTLEQQLLGIFSEVFGRGEGPYRVSRLIQQHLQDLVDGTDDDPKILTHSDLLLKVEKMHTYYALLLHLVYQMGDGLLRNETLT
jgi:hypothetical protein